MTITVTCFVISLDFGYVLHHRNIKGSSSICMALLKAYAQKTEFDKTALIEICLGVTSTLG